MGIFSFFKSKKRDSHIRYSKDNIPNSVKGIDEHLNQFFDKNEDIVVLDEIESEVIHRNIFIIKSNKERPYHILLSCGMSAIPMKIPEDIESSEFCEVMMLLPKDWNIEYEFFDDERNYWPFRLIKELMMLPHPNKTWLGYGHTFEYEENEEYAENVGFNSVILLNSIELSKEFTEIKLNDNKVIDIYTLIPLYKEELIFKKENGTSKLLEKFDDFDIDEIIKIGRKNVCI